MDIMSVSVRWWILCQ